MSDAQREARRPCSARPGPRSAARSASSGSTSTSSWSWRRRRGRPGARDARPPRGLPRVRRGAREPAGARSVAELRRGCRAGHPRVLLRAAGGRMSEADNPAASRPSARSPAPRRPRPAGAGGDPGPRGRRHRLPLARAEGRRGGGPRAARRVMRRERADRPVQAALRRSGRVAQVPDGSRMTTGISRSVFS